MKIFIEKESNSSLETIILPIYEEEDFHSACERNRKFLNDLKERNVFKGEFGQVYHYTKQKEEGLKNIIFLGIGKIEELDSEKIRIAVSKAIRKAIELKFKRINIKYIEQENLCPAMTAKAIFEGAALANYRFNKYKSKKEEYIGVEEFIVRGISEKNFEVVKDACKEDEVIIDSIISSRDLVNEPANVIYPETLAKRVLEIGKESGFEVEVLEEEAIKELNMEAFLSVAKGSYKKPRLIVMRYFGDSENSEDIIGLVGKGLTYDTGGYSIKPTSGMLTMKCDMGGAAAVIGAISAIAKNKLKKNVVAVVAACENLISGDSYKPGDIIGSMGGKNIEVVNTDAEGRLTLIDAVYYAISKENVNKIVDIATLTGSAVGALGNSTTAVVSNNDDFYSELEKASKDSCERIWRMPAFEDYKELLKSDVADLKNSSGAVAGCVTAGMFIGEFVGKTPWLHLDIAGTAWSNGEKDYLTVGGTGVGVKTLYYLVKNN